MNILGYFIISLPFIALFIFMVKDSGIKTALSVTGLCILIITIIGIGAYLITAYPN